MYILRISCSALICGALGCIGGSGKEIRKAVYGIFLAFMVISPLREIRFDVLGDLPGTLQEEGAQIGEAAVQTAAKEICAVIIKELESYIMVEADSLGAEISVSSIQLDPETMEPVEITLSGEISPYKKKLLSEFLEQKLGVGKEQQIWNGENWESGSEDTNTP